MVRYFLDVSNILRNEMEQSDFDKGELLSEVMESLNMTEKELLSCHGKSATSTARKIIRFMFPNPEDDFKFSDVADSIVDGIISKDA